MAAPAFEAEGREFAARAASMERTAPAGRSWLVSATLYAVLVGGALVVAFPFLWMVLTSFKNLQESNAYPPPCCPRSGVGRTTGRRG